MQLSPLPIHIYTWTSIGVYCINRIMLVKAQPIVVAWNNYCPTPPAPQTKGSRWSPYNTSSLTGSEATPRKRARLFGVQSMGVQVLLYLFVRVAVREKSFYILLLWSALTDNREESSVSSAAAILEESSFFSAGPKNRRTVPLAVSQRRATSQSIEFFRRSFRDDWVCFRLMP